MSMPEDNGAIEELARLGLGRVLVPVRGRQALRGASAGRRICFSGPRLSSTTLHRSTPSRWKGVRCGVKSADGPVKSGHDEGRRRR